MWPKSKRVTFPVWAPFSWNLVMCLLKVMLFEQRLQKLLCVLLCYQQYHINAWNGSVDILPIDYLWNGQCRSPGISYGYKPNLFNCVSILSQFSSNTKYKLIHIIDVNPFFQLLTPFFVPLEVSTLLLFWDFLGMSLESLMNIN